MNRYYVRQKLWGVVMLVITAIACHEIGDYTFALLTVPLSAMAIFTKERVIYETEE